MTLTELERKRLLKEREEILTQSTVTAAEMTRAKEIDRLLGFDYAEQWTAKYEKASTRERLSMVDKLLRDARSLDRDR